MAVYLPKLLGLQKSLSDILHITKFEIMQIFCLIPSPNRHSGNKRQILLISFPFLFLEEITVNNNFTTNSYKKRNRQTATTSVF